MPRSSEPDRAAASQQRLAYANASGEPGLLDRSLSLRPLLASTGAPWSDLVRLEHHRLPAGEIPEQYARDHRVGLHLSGPPGQIDWWIAGEGTRQIVCRLGVFSLITAGALHRSFRHHESEILVLSLEPRFVQALAERTDQGGRVEFLPRLAAGDPAIRHLLLALWAELQAGCPSGRLFGEGLATALTVHLLRRHAVVPARSDPHRGGLPPAQLRRVLDLVEAHLGEDTSLRRLAALVQLSPHHFVTVFKQSTGLAPHQYVLRRRIEKAKELLADEPRLSLAEVGYALGFASQAHFTVMFRKLVGTTPGAYRVGR